MENGKITLLTKNIRERDSSRKLRLYPDFEPKVALIKAHPDLNPAVIDWYVEQGYRGIIFEGTGLGHVGDYLFSAIRNANEKNVVLAMTSQCIWGRLNMNVYDQGRDLQALGVISLDDMLAETAFVKLRWVLAQTSDPAEAKKLMLENVAHELLPRTVYDQVGI
jgi:glutamyl-tRNA(Gln) amidotransferase subunit D